MKKILRIINMYFLDNKKLIIIDFGSMYLSEILTIIKNSNSKLCIEVVKWNEFDDMLCRTLDLNLAGIILSGSPSHLYEPEPPIISNKIFSLYVPILGICYGMQIIMHLNNAQVIKMDTNEFGNYEIELEQSNLFLNLNKKIIVKMRHCDKVIDVPEYFKVLAKTENCIAATEYVDPNKYTYIYCLQFHPELDPEGAGNIIMENFLNICNNCTK
jgi:GMP synthase (glutamine-hydrolysing)